MHSAVPKTIQRLKAKNQQKIETPLEPYQQFGKIQGASPQNLLEAPIYCGHKGTKLVKHQLKTFSLIELRAPPPLGQTISKKVLNYYLVSPIDFLI